MLNYDISIIKNLRGVLWKKHIRTGCCHNMKNALTDEAHLLARVYCASALQAKAARENASLLKRVPNTDRNWKDADRRMRFLLTSMDGQRY